MAFRKTFYIVVALLFLGKLSLEADLRGLNANNDQGFWFEQFVQKELSKDWSLILHLQQRWGDDYRRLWDLRNELVFHYNVTPHLNLSPDSIIKRLNIGPGYLGSERLQRDTRGIYHWIWLNMSILESNLQAEICQWRINQRLRCGYVSHARKNYHDHGVLRYLLAFYTPWKLTCWNINPYFSNEWFFRNNGFNAVTNPTGLVGGWHLNQFRVGFDADLIPDSISTTLYWQWRTVKHRPDVHPRWFNIYMLGLALNLSF